MKTSKKYHLIVKRILLFVGILCLAVLFAATLCACDGEDINDLFQPPAFITFVLNNGQRDIIWQFGEEVPVPIKQGYEFLYWCVDENCEIKADTSFDKAPEEDLTLYAKWKKLADIEGVRFNDSTVTYDGKAHSIALELPTGAKAEYEGESSFINAGTYTISVVVKKNGCSDLRVSATLTVLKAKVEDIVFNSKTVDWDGNEHSIFIENELPSAIKVNYVGNGAKDVGIHTVTAKFDVGNNYESIPDVSAELTINAIEHTLIFTDGESRTEIKVKHGESVTNPPALRDIPGYVGKWNANLDNIQSDMNISAIYTLVIYKITYIVNGGKVDGKTTYDVKTEVIMPVAKRDYYIFDGWYDNSGKKVEKIEKGSLGDVTLTAKWTAIEYTITYHDAYMNTFNNENNSAFTVESDAYVFENAERTGYVFAGWYDNADFDGEPIAVREKGSHGNLDLYAKWEKVQ